MVGSSEAGHGMGRQMCTYEMLLMVWVGSEWSHERRKGVATAVALIFKGCWLFKNPMFLWDIDKVKV